MKGGRDLDLNNAFNGIVPLLAIAMFISFPSFLFFWLIIFLIIKSPFLLAGKFILWLFVAPLIVLANGYFVLWMLSGPCINAYDFFCGEFNREDMVYFHPAAVATFLSVAVRYRQFLKLNKSYI